MPTILPEALSNRITSTASARLVNLSDLQESRVTPGALHIMYQDHLAEHNSMVPTLGGSMVRNWRCRCKQTSSRAKGYELWGKAKGLKFNEWARRDMMTYIILGRLDRANRSRLRGWKTGTRGHNWMLDTQIAETLRSISAVSGWSGSGMTLTKWRRQFHM